MSGPRGNWPERWLALGLTGPEVLQGWLAPVHYSGDWPQDIAGVTDLRALQG